MPNPVDKTHIHWNTNRKLQNSEQVLVKEGWRTSKNYFFYVFLLCICQQTLLKGVPSLKPGFTIQLPLISTSSFFPIGWYELSYNVLNHPHFTSRISRADELLIPFLLLLLYKSNELLILSSFPHFLLWLCMPLLHCLNRLFCAALAHPCPFCLYLRYCWSVLWWGCDIKELE